MLWARNRRVLIEQAADNSGPCFQLSPLSPLATTPVGLYPAVLTTQQIFIP